jgi:hypothetical protein
LAMKSLFLKGSRGHFIVWKLIIAKYTLKYRKWQALQHSSLLTNFNVKKFSKIISASQILSKFRQNVKFSKVLNLRNRELLQK